MAVTIIFEILKFELSIFHNCSDQILSDVLIVLIALTTYDGVACMLHTFQQLLKILNTTYQHLQVVSFMRLRRMLSVQLVQSVRLTKFDQNNCEKSIIRI